MINKINNTTNSANPPEKPQLPPQLPPNPIIVPPLIRGENKGSLMFFNGFHLLYVLTHKREQVLLKIKKDTLRCLYPALMGSKTPTSKFSESKEFRWGSGCR